MKIRCPNCQKIFDADSSLELFINAAIQKGQRLCMTDCPECYKNIPLNPTELLSTEIQKDEDQKNGGSEIIECPVCTDGLISYIDDGKEKFWGCGECGNVWFSEEALQKSITEGS